MSDSDAIESSLFEPSVGQHIDGRYRLEERLGTGTQGVTYRARHLEHQRVVALKLLHEDVRDDALRRGRFEWESATLAALGHPNIAAIVDYGVHEGRRWVAGEWLEGETLATRLACGALPLTAAMTIVRQLLAALASAHGARLLHRNLKPSNVFLERRSAQGRERVKLLDFAPALRSAKGAVPVPVPVPAELLSPYSPPELVIGEVLDARSDVYAVGATLIGMLSGGAALEPLPAETTADAVGARASAPDRARALPGVDATLMAWIRRATMAQRSLRFVDAADMLRELIDLLPRDLRSPPDSGDGTSRAVTMPISRPIAHPTAEPSSRSVTYPTAEPSSRSVTYPTAEPSSRSAQLLQVRPSAVPPPLPRRTGPPPMPRRSTPSAPIVTSDARVPVAPAAPVTVAVVPIAEVGDGSQPKPGLQEFRTVFQVPPRGDEEPGGALRVPNATRRRFEGLVLGKKSAASADVVAAEPNRVTSSHESSRGTLRPMESQIIAVTAEPRVRQLMAAAVFGAFVIAVVVIFLQPGGHGRASMRDVGPAATPNPSRATEALDPMEVKSPAATPVVAAAQFQNGSPVPAPEVVQLPNEPAAPVNNLPDRRAELAVGNIASAPAAAPAAASGARSNEPAIVPGPGRPPVRDPWQDPLPAELKRARDLAMNGAPGDEGMVKMLRAYKREHPGDVRAHLLIAQLFANRLWRTDCVEELTIALERDPTARGAPEILPALLDMIAQGKAQVLAETLVLKAYGGEALDAIEAAFDDVKKPTNAARLHALRLKITGGAPQ